MEGSYLLDISIMYMTDNIFMLRILSSMKVRQKTKHLSRQSDFFYCPYVMCNLFSNFEI